MKIIFIDFKRINIFIYEKNFSIIQNKILSNLDDKLISFTIKRFVKKIILIIISLTFRANIFNKYRIPII